MDEMRKYGIIDVIHLDVRKVESFDVDAVKKSLRAIGYTDEPFLNDFWFCPHIICALDDDGNLFIDNVNNGNYSSHTRRNHIIDCSDANDFITRVSELAGKKVIDKSEPKNNGALF